MKSIAPVVSLGVDLPARAEAVEAEALRRGDELKTALLLPLVEADPAQLERAFANLLEPERFDRVVVPASADGGRFVTGNGSREQP